MQEQSPITPLAGPSYHGTPEQVHAIQNLEKLGWLFLHWTEIPLLLAVMQKETGDVVFIDTDGHAWRTKAPASHRAGEQPG